MKYNLPDFDTLLEISKTDPNGLNRIKQEATAALIDDAPEAHKQRLRGIQFQVDMELRKSKSPMDGCIRTSRIMQESLTKLRHALNKASEAHTLGTLASVELVETKNTPTTADILPFHQFS